MLHRACLQEKKIEQTNASEAALQKHKTCKLADNKV